MGGGGLKHSLFYLRKVVSGGCQALCTEHVSERRDEAVLRAAMHHPRRCVAFSEVRCLARGRGPDLLALSSTSQKSKQVAFGLRGDGE